MFLLLAATACVLTGSLARRRADATGRQYAEPDRAANLQSDTQPKIRNKHWARQDDDMAQRYGDMAALKPLVRQSAAGQREENRADVDEYGGGASFDVTFAPAERDHIQPEPEQSIAENFPG
jgi:hypothetical protein